MLPWWGSLYLAVLALLTFAGIIEELKKPGGRLYALGTFITLSIVVAFVFGYFRPEIGEMIGFFSIPLLFIVLFYDFVLSRRNLVIGSKNFLKPTDQVTSRMDLLTASLIVAPGYVAGFVILYRSII